MAITLPDLPYARGALAPHISENTLDFHYGKHHQAYVDNLNKMIDGTDHANASLEEIIQDSAGDSGKAGVFNNSAQVWNHTFYWNSMSPNGGGAPSGDVANAIKDAFGGFDGFKEEFSTAGATQFGSGWAWLVAKDGKVEVRKTPNAETPLTEDGVHAAPHHGCLGTCLLSRLSRTSARPIFRRSSTVSSTGTLPTRICRRLRCQKLILKKPLHRQRLFCEIFKLAFQPKC